MDVVRTEPICYDEMGVGWQAREGKGGRMRTSGQARMVWVGVNTVMSDAHVTWMLFSEYILGDRV